MQRFVLKLTSLPTGSHEAKQQILETWVQTSDQFCLCQVSSCSQGALRRVGHGQSHPSRKSRDQRSFFWGIGSKWMNPKWMKDGLILRWAYLIPFQTVPSKFTNTGVSLGFLRPVGQFEIGPEMGVPPKRMVYFMENPTKMDDFGVPLFHALLYVDDLPWPFEHHHFTKPCFFSPEDT